MKEKIQIIILFIALILAVFGINKLMESETEKILNTNAFANNAVENEIDESEIIPESKIISVTKSTFDEEVLKSDKKVVVDFYADWCGPCKMLSPILEQVASENEDIKIVKVDSDVEYELSVEYKVNSIPYLVIFEDGKVIDTSVGLISKAELEALLEIK